MNKLIVAALFAVVSVATVACGKKEQPAAPAQPAASQPTQAQAPGGETAAAPAAETPATTEESAPTASTETVTETDDAQESADQPATGTQPTLKLSAAANKPPTSERFKEGVNYKKVVPAQPTNVAPGKIEVVEVFWYGCGHCFQLDPAIESWKNKNKQPFMEFVRVPAMWNDTLRLHARLYYTAEALGKLDALHSTIFREMHVANEPLNNVERITAFFKKNGVSPEDFQKAFSSFAVESKLQRADFLNRRYQINSVPTMVVNGKYLTDVSMAGGESQLFQLIEELAAHEHGG
ncbi:MAG TPA: thiol:disulfide interchange protein DsbA/DsbL [Steroidobacteraceae bacterium]|nr:thiol:disulfide interchange protein DsbA/DsbL [Steroidobacteraceae bacterium]